MQNIFKKGFCEEHMQQAPDLEEFGCTKAVQGDAWTGLNKTHVVVSSLDWVCDMLNKTSCPT